MIFGKNSTTDWLQWNDATQSPTEPTLEAVEDKWLLSGPVYTKIYPACTYGIVLVPEDLRISVYTTKIPMHVRKFWQHVLSGL
jgi:hypothetical protein